MKKYHPLRMHGSYVGLVAGFVISYFTLVALSILGEFSELKTTMLLLAFVPLLVGFVLGWGLHSLARSLKNDIY